MSKACEAGVMALVAALLGGCGGHDHTPTTPTKTSITWRLNVETRSEASFGARVLIDGEQVYLDANPTQLSHQVEVVRPYAPGAHRLEVEIVSSTKSPAVYVASCAALVNPNGNGVHADGAPWTLSPGQRLYLLISL